MITYVTGDLFQSPAQTLVNAVNTEGIMGKGIASDFKRLYPEMFEQYRALCETGQFKMGQLWLYKSPSKWILNFPTKESRKEKSKLTYIQLGLEKFVQTYADKGITSIAFPMLGCGLGGLNWEAEVQPLMEKFLNELPIHIHVYRPETSQINPSSL